MTAVRPGPGALTTPTGRPRPAREAQEDRPADVAVIAMADLGLLALAFGTAAAFTRLFDDWSFLSRLAVPILIAWGLAVLLRHLRVRTAGALVVHLAVGVVVLTVMFAPGTHLLGLPGPATIELLRTSVTTSFSEFSALVAPVAPSDGFLVLIAAGLWIFALFADTAAFRYDGPVQAAIPYVSTFLATGLLANDPGRLPASVAFVSGLAVYAVTERTLRASEARWVGPSRRRGSRSVGVVAAAIGVCAVVAGAALGPLLPGSGDAVIDLRELGKGGGPRTVVSPFVGLRSLLGVRSDTEMFTVNAVEPAYWRLTALEEFDESRDIWVSRGTYRPTDGDLPSVMARDVPGAPLRQDIDISGLSGPWLPGAYDPRAITSDVEVTFDRESASIILPQDQDAADGPVVYRLDSVVPDLDAARRAAAGGAADLDPVYMESPDLASRVTDRLRAITDGRTTDFERAIALQDFFRDNFTYDEDVDYRDAEDPLLTFLEDGRGFCQQFSSAFALMARAIDLPSRVAVGFTPGDPVAAPGGTNEVQYVVRGRHAHAWPEVYFEGVGWVPFEPTPGRGDPQTTGLTGATPGQATPPPAQAATTTSTVTPGETQPVDPSAPTTAPDQVDATAEPPDPQTAGDGSGTSPWLVAMGLVALALVGAAVVLIHRRSRARHRAPRRMADGRIDDAWVRSAGWLSLVGLRPQTWETPTEFADRVTSVLLAENGDPTSEDRPAEKPSFEELPVADPHGDALRSAATAIQVLAAAETSRRYGSIPPSAARYEAAEHAAAAIKAYARLESSRRQRVGHFIRG